MSLSYELRQLMQPELDAYAKEHVKTRINQIEKRMCMKGYCEGEIREIIGIPELEEWGSVKTEKKEVRV